MTAYLTTINGKLRLNKCGGVLVEADAADEPCCCECNCGPKITYSWTQTADGIPVPFPASVVCSSTAYRTCEKWQVIARRTRPAFGGYPRVLNSGTIERRQENGVSTRCLIGLPNPYRSHLGLKGYSIDYELWVMCADQNYNSPPKV